MALCETSETEGYGFLENKVDRAFTDIYMDNTNLVIRHLILIYIDNNMHLFQCRQQRLSHSSMYSQSRGCARLSHSSSF